MRFSATALFASVLFFNNAFAQSEQAETSQSQSPESQASAPAEDQLEVVVSGEQPGPGFWKVSKGDHVMWILGTHGPLPKKMIWRSSQVKSLIAQSQELLNPVRQRIDTNIGFFKTLTLIPALLKSDRNPNDAELKDVVPADVYARWLVLKEKHFGNGGARLETMRPTFAMQNLQAKAIEQAGLKRSNDVAEAVAKAAKKGKLKITTPEVTIRIEIDNPKAVLKKFRNTPFDDVECFSKTLDRFETDINDSKSRAVAWAMGDVATLRRLNNPNAEDCNGLFMQALLSGTLAEELGAQKTVDRLKIEVKRVANEMDAKWMEAAEAALANNNSTVAMLPIGNILHPEGYVTKLREKGYVVDEPQ
jgi:uncharacterized protein YbaP (TraB family)